jgi:uncharacterized damage-inducible protein DinB
MVDDLVDPRRSEPDYLLDERPMLEAWLEFHRMTLLLKCEGLDDRQRKAHPVPTSLLSLHGLVRHMAEVERIWFRSALLREPDAPSLFGRVRQGSVLIEADLAPLDDADWSSDVSVWKAECESSRQASAGRSLDSTGLRHGEPCSLRWIYAHMIEEYARHNGHADLLREMVDGAVGW